MTDVSCEVRHCASLRCSEFLQVCGTKDSTKALAVDSHCTEFFEVGPCRNIVVLVAFIAFQRAEFHTPNIALEEQLSSSLASSAAMRITCTSGPLEVLKLVIRRISLS